MFEKTKGNRLENQIDPEKKKVINKIQGELEDVFQESEIIDSGNYKVLKKYLLYKKHLENDKDQSFKDSNIISYSQIEKESHSIQDKIEAVKKYLDQGVDIDLSQLQGCEYTDIYQCAKWVRSTIEKTNVLIDVVGIRGNAWDMIKNIQDHGGQVLYNIYDKYEDIFEDNSVQELKENTQKITQNENFDGLYQIGDIVGLFWEDSSYHKIAQDDQAANTKNTHIGFVSNIKNVNGQKIPIISHNVRGIVVHQSINGLNLAWVARPDYQKISTNTKKIYYQFQEYWNKISNHLDQGTFKKKVLQKIKEKLK